MQYYPNVLSDTVKLLTNTVEKMVAMLPRDKAFGSDAKRLHRQLTAELASIELRRLSHCLNVVGVDPDVWDLPPATRPTNVDVFTVSRDAAREWIRDRIDQLLDKPETEAIGYEPATYRTPLLGVYQPNPNALIPHNIRNITLGLEFERRCVQDISPIYNVMLVAEIKVLDEVTRELEVDVLRIPVEHVPQKLWDHITHEG